MYILIIFALISQVSCESVCEHCVCRFDNQVQDDFQGETVDCSYKEANILLTNRSLPNMVYSLHLASNNLTAVHTSSLLKSKTMEQLFLDDNSISEIRGSVFLLPELKRMDLSNNLLEYIDKETFRDVKKLEHLNLANNKFTHFDKLTFHRLGSLQQVILDNNNIGPSLQSSNLFDRNGFGLTAKIQSVSMSGIHLNTVPDNFFVDAYDIRKLIISNNNLSDVFEFPFTLEVLDLSDNPIPEISSEDFTDLPGLKELKLNNLAMKVIPEDLFTPLHSLLVLQLERNKNLTVFSTNAFGREVLEDAEGFTLEELSLKGSRLKTLDAKLAVPFGQLLRLDLQGNPWNCDCNLVWIKKLQINDKNREHLRCNTPDPLFNARIFDLKAKYFTCPEPKHVAFTVAVSAFVIVLAGIALWLYFYLPKYQSRSAAIRQMYAHSTAYSILPITANMHEF